MRSPISLLSTLLLTTLTTAIPLTPTTPLPTPAAPPAFHPAPLGLSIHSSCSSTQTRQLIAGLTDTEEFVSTALSHIHTHGRTSPIFQKYFGDSPTAEVIGWFSRILYAAKPGALLRCDDVDGNCANDPTWAGHHRGSNSTEQTVICPPSFTLRLRLDKFCTQGHTIAGNKTNIFWASDLLHRLLHVPGVSEEAVLHYSDGYQEVLEWAESTNGTVRERRTKNSDGLIYFALESYAEIVVPGGGCVGVAKEKEGAHGVTSTTVAATPAVTSTSVATAPAATATTSVEPAKPTEEKKDCHTHDDGSVHCV